VASPEGAIRKVVEDLADAWNRRDWQSFGRLFAEDADYVTGAAIRLAGRGRIQEALSSQADTSLESSRVSLNR